MTTADASRTADGRPIIVRERLTGGGWNSTWRGTCGDHSAIIKRYPRRGSLYHVEAQALTHLRDHLPRTPRVLHWDTTQIVLEDKGAHPIRDWHGLGRDIAHLHQVKSNSYGWHADNYIGMRAVDQSRTPDCLAYYRQQRYEPVLADALAKGHLAQTLAERIHAATAIFARWGDEEPPCLVHGDCWPGNLIGDAAGSGVLIDPCLHCGTPYEDLYNLIMWQELPAAFWRGYTGVRPLRHGWRDETPILQLYHLLDILCHVGPKPWLTVKILDLAGRAEQALRRG